MRYTIWTVAPYSGDVRDLIAEYSNKGQAIARLRGLRRAAWKAASEMEYRLLDESGRDA